MRHPLTARGAIAVEHAVFSRPRFVLFLLCLFFHKECFSCEACYGYFYSFCS